MTLTVSGGGGGKTIQSNPPTHNKATNPTQTNSNQPTNQASKQETNPNPESKQLITNLPSNPKQTKPSNQLPAPVPRSDSSSTRMDFSIWLSRLKNFRTENTSPEPSKADQGLSGFLVGLDWRLGGFRIALYKSQGSKPDWCFGLVVWWWLRGGCVPIPNLTYYPEGSITPNGLLEGGSLPIQALNKLQTATSPHALNLSSSPHPPYGRAAVLQVCRSHRARIAAVPAVGDALVLKGVEQAWDIGCKGHRI